MHLNIKKKLNVSSITVESLIFGILLASVGGFLDAYTFVGRGGVFANAQTGNIILVAVSAVNEEWKAAFTHFIPILAFIAGVMISESLRERKLKFLYKDIACTTLIIETLILFLIGFVPKTVSNDIVNIIISFVASMQYCAFKKLSGAPYATTFCTGNLRSASLAAYSALTKKDKEDFLKSMRYFIVIFSFLMGAIIGGFLTVHVGDSSVWLAVVVLIFSFMLLNSNTNEIEKALEDNSKAS